MSSYPGSIVTLGLSGVGLPPTQVLFDPTPGGTWLNLTRIGVDGDEAVDRGEPEQASSEIQPP